MRRANLERMLPLTAVLALGVLTACGSETTTGLDDGFDAGVSAGLVEAAANAEWANLSTGHAGLVVLAVKNTGPATAVVPGLDDDRVGSVGQRAGVSLGGKLMKSVATASFSTTGRNGILPDEVLGRTYTLAGQTAGGYAIDEGSTDAPPDGARFHMYELDQVTGRPKLIPISRAGQLDLVEPIPRAGLDVYATNKSGDVLADLSIARTVVDDGVSRVSTLTSSGTLVKSKPFTYTFLDHVDVGAGFSRIDFEFDRELASEERDIRVTFETDGYITYVGEGTAGVVNLLMVIESAGHTVVVEVVDDGTFASGSVTYDGELMVQISGDNAIPDFTHPDGSFLDGGALEDMWELWYAYDLMLFFGDELIIPLSTLIL